MSKLSTQPYKGARDFYPEDKRLHKWLMGKWASVVEAYGYEEYDAPILEPTELYRAKSGQEIVNDQSYSFVDRGNREVTIRPEMTPTVSRMVAGKRQELAYPVRWYSVPNLWRYERPQRGRLREHWQLNVDIFGVDTVDAELELIMIAYDIMKAVGAKDSMFKIRINSRKLINLIMADYLGLDVVQSHMMMKLFDKKNKIDEATFYSEAASIFDEDADSEGITKLTKLIESHSMADLPQQIKESQYVKSIHALFALLKEQGIDNAVFDVGLMRGFDYYTDIVFEVFDTHPDNNRSLFGGGRYDGLVGLFGVEPVPTVGFGMGDVTMIDFVNSHNLAPTLNSETDIYIVPIGNTLREVQGIAKILRGEGVNVAVGTIDKKIDKHIKAAVKKHIPYAMFVGENELTSERFKLKNLIEGTEDELSLARIVSKVLDYRSTNNN